MSIEGEPQCAESKYELREVIGKGAFGEVNLVVEKQTKQRFVLKRIKMARQSEWQRKATRQEIEIVSRLKHPFIMPYKEHWTHHGHTINVVYGYCEKGDLTTAIAKQKGKLFPEETLRLWLAQLLLAVEYMHRANVLHRDIKTQNILLTGDGDVQIGDFGLSTVRVPSGEAAHAQIHAHPLSFADDTDPRTDASPPPHRHHDGSHGGAATPEHGKAPHHAHHQAGVDAFGLMGGNANGHHPHVVFNTPPGQGNAAHGQGQTPANGSDKDKDKDRDKDQLGAQTPVHDPKAGTRNDYALVGTPHFMSPELLSSQKYSFETDIWSLGVVMYELTTLKPPFNAFNLAGLVAKIKRAALPPIPSSYSADWNTLLKSMLRKEPKRRATALDVLTADTMLGPLRQAFERARAIDPRYQLPDFAAAALASKNPSPGVSFTFDTVAAGGSGAAQRTSATTPGLGHPAHGSEDPQSPPSSSGNSEPETSPMSKFPDLGASAASAAAASTAAATEREPPRNAGQPPRPMVRSTTAPRLHAPTVASDAQDVERSKTPKLVRGRSGTAAGAQPAAAPSPAAVSRRNMTPQAGRPVAAPARSRTPVRSGAGASAPSLLSPRVRPAASPAPRASAGEEAPSAGGRLVRKASIPLEARGRAASVPSAAAATTPAKAEADGKPRGAVVPPLALAPIIAPPPAADATDGVDGMAVVIEGRSGTQASTPTSAAGSLKSQLSGAAAVPAAAVRSKDQPPVRAGRAQSFTTRSTARASPAAGATPASGRDGAGGPIAASSPTAAGASGQKRRVTTNAAPESSPPPPGLHATSSARFRAAATPAAAAATPSAAGPPQDRRRSQPGSAAAAAKDTPDAAAPREKRVRRSSYVSYSRPGTEAAAPARRQTGAPSPGPARDAAGAPDAAAGTDQPASSAAAPAGARANDSSAGCSAGGCSVESFPAAPADAVPPLQLAEGADAPQAAAGVSFSPGKDAAGGTEEARQTSGGGVAAGPSSHPWRMAPRSRSFMSMTTEDSELSLPDGRYALSPEVSTGGCCEAESAAGGTRPTSMAGAPPGGVADAATGLTLWSSNQLYSSNYGSLGGALAEAAASAAAAEAAGAPAAQQNRAQDPLAQSIDLPRRVSVSAFSPHLFAGAPAAGGAPGSPGGCSTAESSPVVATARHRSAGGATEAPAEPKAGGDGEPGGAPGADVPSTPRTQKAFTMPDSPGSFSSLSAPPSDSSPSIGLSPRLGTEVHALSPRLMENRESPVAAPPPQQQQQQQQALQPAPQPRRRLQATAGQGFGSGRSFRRPGRVAQQAVMRAHREMEIAFRPVIDASGAAPDAAPPPRPASMPGGPVEETSLGGSHGGSSSASARRSFGGFAVHVAPAAAAAHQAGPAAWRLASGGSSSNAGSSADATSTLRPVAEEGCDEAESAPLAAGSGVGGGAHGGALGPSEREQLALLQRVVSVAGSLLEAGRVGELYSVLSSTLSRPLAQPAAAAPKRPDLEDRVRLVAGPFRGVEAVVRFRGPCHWCAGEVLGLELPPSADGDEATSALRGAAPDAVTAGSRDGVIYFRCQRPEARTTFVAPQQVTLLD